MADNGNWWRYFFYFFFWNSKQNRRNIVKIIYIDNQVAITIKK